MYPYHPIRSSFNPDRIAACMVNKPRKVSRPYARHYWAQYTGNTVSVCFGRGYVKFSRTFDSRIVGAVCRNGMLEVDLAGGVHCTFDISTGIRAA